MAWLIVKEPMSLYPAPQNSLHVSAEIDVPDFSGGPGTKATGVSPWGGVY